MRSSGAWEPVLDPRCRQPVPTDQPAVGSVRAGAWSRMFLPVRRFLAETGLERRRAGLASVAAGTALGGRDLCDRCGGNAAPRAGVEPARRGRRDALLPAAEFSSR